jgi:hypothetical protein
LPWGRRARSFTGWHCSPCPAGHLLGKWLGGRRLWGPGQVLTASYRVPFSSQGSWHLNGENDWPQEATGFFIHRDVVEVGMLRGPPHTHTHTLPSNLL